MSTAGDAHSFRTREFAANVFLPDTCSILPPRLRFSKGRRQPDHHLEAPVYFRPAFDTLFGQTRMGEGEGEILETYRKTFRGENGLRTFLHVKGCVL